MEGEKEMRNRVITISREPGSGGGAIGRRVAEKLGIACYGRELLEKIAAESGFDTAYAAALNRGAAHGGYLTAALSDRAFNGHSNRDDLWIAQYKVISELAASGPCVFVGQCADYILRNQADCLTVWVHSDLSRRAAHTGLPEKRIRALDRRRAAQYQFNTGFPWGAAQNYQLTLDSGVLGTEKCADIIAAVY